MRNGAVTMVMAQCACSDVANVFCGDQYIGTGLDDVYFPVFRMIYMYVNAVTTLSTP